MTKRDTFSGGIILEGHKQASKIIDSTLPPELIYPLLQRSGIYAKPIVHPGELVLKGQIIANSCDKFGTPIHAASSGNIKEIAAHPIAHPSGLSDTCIVIETDGLDNAVASQPCIDYLSETPEKLREKILQAGIVGLGGAVFPTAKKLKATNIHSLIINGAECEPYISCDESLMQAHAQQLIQGALIMQTILQAEQCIIAIEDNMSIAKQALNSAISQQAIQLISVPTIYPAGGENQLIQAVTGTKIPDRSLPAEHGILCQNIGTAYAVYQAICLGTPLTERIITITGKGIKQAINIRAKIGTPIKHLVNQSGGYTSNVDRLVMGGPMMGISLSTDDIAVTKASNCILALTADDMMNRPATMPCIRCGDCANVCPSELLPQQLYWYSRSQQLEQCQDYRLFNCIECGCCDIVCPSHIPLVQMFRVAKGDLVIKQQQSEQASLANQRYQNRQQRLARIDLEKLDKAKKRKAAIEKMKLTAAEKRKNMN